MTADTAGQEFVLVATYLAESGQLSLTTLSDNTVIARGPPDPAPEPPPSSLSRFGVPQPASPRRESRLHEALRDLEIRELSQRISWSPSVDRRVSSMGKVAPIAGQSLGDLMTLNTQSRSACEDPHPATGRVRAVSNHAIVVADTANPANGFESADFEHFSATFDTLIAPVAEEHFGTPSDIDGNGRVIIFLTKEVNALGKGEDAFTAGFFFSRDLFPRVSPGPPLGSCETSNEAELLYLVVPDPTGIAGEPISRHEADQLAVVTMAHEYQHLINASGRLLGSTPPRPFEESWLNEALSHAMEELLFYEVSHLTPGLDLGIEDLAQDQIVALNRFQRLNFLRFREFLATPGQSSPFAGEVGLGTRGGAWNFLRYSADHGSPDDAAFFRTLVQSATTGTSSLADALGGQAIMLDLLGDWSVGLYADNRVPGLPERFWDLSWNNSSLFEASGLAGPYIATSSLPNNPMVSRQLRPGGSAFFRFGVSEGEVAQVDSRSGGNALPPSLRFVVLRTK